MREVTFWDSSTRRKLIQLVKQIDLLQAVKITLLLPPACYILEYLLHLREYLTRILIYTSRPFQYLKAIHLQ